ncbi:hypothetical protein H4R33_003244 [Dimargaris cristalligena]|uniref:Uncharacterized protein n=1 Tax=Dimargaris cristalligena TaxID=215637 RepID=A0A4P9ZZ08_9FUNG|nr:hypothetical protein H4R33_003244 [Dimargaris cristalligena]RKP38995.1 hypothetical protein BJ085DRAFT_37942 [Dimargaris cristalligena]|eukprot:RKP38995.1 hypothetical protein BJ085DRAFT_37942 [Dimargaris cristalligena]
MKSALISISVVGLALAQFASSLPQRIPPPSNLAGGVSSPQLFRRAENNKRQATSGPNNDRQPKISNTAQAGMSGQPLAQANSGMLGRAQIIAQSALSEADYSLFLTTYSLPTFFKRASPEQQKILAPVMDALHSNHAEIKLWADSLDFVRTDRMVKDELHNFFPVVAKAYEDIRVVDTFGTLVYESYTKGILPTYYPLSGKLPGLAQIQLPNVLAKNSLFHLFNYVKGHLAALYVRDGKLDQLKMIIRSGITAKNRPSEPVPMFNFGEPAFFSTEPEEMEPGELPDRPTERPARPALRKNPQLAGREQGPADGNRSSTGDSATPKSDEVKYKFSNNIPLDANNSGALHDTNNLFLATLYLWAIEYQIPGFEQLFTEIGNPFLINDIPCIRTLGYTNAHNYLAQTFQKPGAIITNSDDVFACYRRFTLHGFVYMAPQAADGTAEILVRHNRRLGDPLRRMLYEDTPPLLEIVHSLQSLNSLANTSRIGFIDVEDMARVFITVKEIENLTQNFDNVVYPDTMVQNPLGSGYGPPQPSVNRSILPTLSEIKQELIKLDQSIEDYESQQSDTDEEDYPMAEASEADSSLPNPDEEKFHLLFEDINGKLRQFKEKYLYKTLVQSELNQYSTKFEPTAN